MKEAEYYLLDVFTDKQYGGNPLAIFPEAQRIDETLFQSIARELNLSETVFLFPPDDEGVYPMRIFTPGKELPTAGHPTVGTAFYLASKMGPTADGMFNITFDQKIGKIESVVKMENGKPGIVTMSQPLPAFGQNHNDSRHKIASMLSLQEDALDTLPIQEVSCGNNTLLVPLKSTHHLADISLKTDEWKAFKSQTNNAFLYVFSVRDVTNGDVQGRMFAPEIGIMEDPATGSANGPLACYLTHHHIIEMPATSLQGIEMGRPSEIRLNTTVDQSGNISNVTIAGKSVFTGKGVHFLY